MPTVLFRFPAHRYHATPWGSHVNEGQIEWPPSPWRLLRTLIATGYQTLHWPSGSPPPVAESLIEKLSAVHPRYRLPQAVTGHTRHYMPLATFKNGREDTTLVFDTWAWIEEGELAVTWDVDLSDEEHVLLEQLAAGIGYLGRSESWVDARLADEMTSFAGSECFPSEHAHRPGIDWEQVPLLAPVPPSEYREWRTAAIEAEKSREDLKPAGKKRGKRGPSPEDTYPENTLACLQVTTNWLRRLGWSQPPGSQRIMYWRRRDSLETVSPRPKVVNGTVRPVEYILLSLTAENGNDHVLPSVYRTLPQGELLHRAVVSQATRDGGVPDAILTGQDNQGRPLRGRHEHGHILPLDLNRDGHIDHFLLWAPAGFSADAQKAIRAVRTTYTKRGTAPLRVTLAGLGSASQMLHLSGTYGASLRRIIRDTDGGTRWRTISPFVPPRFPKENGRHSIRGQIRAELDSRNLPLPDAVRVIEPAHDTDAARMRHFVRSRRLGQSPPVDVGFMIELTFRDPVSGPICLGYGAHFGLGLFETVDAQDT